MTSELGIVSALTFRGHDLMDVDGIHLDLHRGGPGEIADVRGTDRVISGADGVDPGNRKVHKRRLELVGQVVGTATDPEDQDSDYWTNRIILASWFDPTVTGALVATLRNGAVYSINARTLPPINYSQMAPADADVAIVLESADPNWELVGS